MKQKSKEVLQTGCFKTEHTQPPLQLHLGAMHAAWTHDDCQDWVAVHSRLRVIPNVDARMVSGIHGSGG